MAMLPLSTPTKSMLHNNSKLHTAQIGREIVDAWSTPPHRPPTPSSNQPTEDSLPSPFVGGGGGRGDDEPPPPPTARPQCSSPSSLVGVFEALELRCGHLMPKKKEFRRIAKNKKGPPESVCMDFNVDGDDRELCTKFMNKLCEKLGNHNDPESKSWFLRSKWSKLPWSEPPHFLLPKQTAAEPARWIVIKLSTGNHKTTLFVRDDNVYLQGFKNQKGQTYESGRGWGGQSGRTPQKNEKAPGLILEDSIPLGYDLNYDDLGGDILRWNLNKISVEEAVIKLATYGTEEHPKCIKKYLARLILIICEAARMYRILERVKKGWFGNGPSFLTAIERDTLNEWVHMSRAMMDRSDNRYNIPGLKIIEVQDDEQAGRVVRLIKYSPMRKKPGDGNGDAPPQDGNGDVPPRDGNGDAQPGDGNGHAPPGDGNGHGAPSGGGSGDGTSPGGGSGDPPSADRNGKSQWRWQQQGRSLVEVSSIQLTEGCTLPVVGSITVFDGERGQIIYLNNEDGGPRVDSKGNLVLTGPYRAISAEGMVALRIAIVSDSHTAEDELLIWDPYTKDAYDDIDELVSGEITENLTLTYAVLSSAVEATVQLDVFLVRKTDFYGEITAHSKLRNGQEVKVVLFSRKIEDKVELESSSAGSTIPLTRSVLAWSVGSPLLIKVACFHSVSVSHCGLRLRTSMQRSFEVEPSFQKCLKFSSEDHIDRLRFSTLEGFGYVRLSVDDTGEYREKTNNSLPRSLMKQMSPDMLTEACQTVNVKRKVDIMRNLGQQYSTDPKDIGTRPKLLVVRTSQVRFITFERKRFITCLLHITNDSDDQHVHFRCRSALEDPHYFIILSGRHISYRIWDHSGILPPNSTSTYLVRHESELHLRREMKTLSLILESHAALHDEKHIDNILPTARVATEKVLANETITSEQTDDFVRLDTWIQKVTLKASISDPADKTTTSEQEEGDVDLDTFFSGPSKGFKELKIKATISNPADLPMTSVNEINIPIMESSIDQRDLLDVYPLQLCFPFEQDKVICCPLRLTNKTSDYVIFKCLPYSLPSSYLYRLDSLNGILPPRSSCTYVVAMKEQKDLPNNMKSHSVILKSCAAQNYISSQDPMLGISTPKAIPDKERIPPRIEIVTVNGYDLEILSMDVHPTEPWILASHSDGYVRIWEYKTRSRLELSVSDVHERTTIRPISVAKFISREKWIVAGDDDGFVCVVTYTTNKEVSKFRAHRKSVRSLAVHPNQPIMLSASFDGVIMLWNWDVNRDPIWQCTRRFTACTRSFTAGFVGHSEVVNHVMFNPHDNGKTFASASHDCTVKIWSTDDLDPIATLKCGQDPQQHVAYFSMGGRQCMITGSLKGAARVWDLKETYTLIKELDGPKCSVFGSNVGVVNCVPYNINPVLITVSGDKGISFLDATTYKPRYDKVNFCLGEPVGFADIEVKGIRSLAIAFKRGIAIMEMNEDPVSSPATMEQAQEGIYSAESSKKQKTK